MKAKESFTEAFECLNLLIQNKTIIQTTEQLAQTIATVFKNKGKVIICGNGGSNCDAMHFAEEFTGRFRHDRQALPVIAISDSSHITCTANDYGYEAVFARGVEAYGQKDDLFIGISTSGNSLNVIKAVEKAKQLKLKTCVFLGKDGGKLAGTCDYEFIVPGKTTDRIQELHMLILHILIEYTERILFPHLY